MPTPLVHLYVGQRIRESLLSMELLSLDERAGDFLLGCIAPDAWSLGGIERSSSHASPIPMPAGVFSCIEFLHCHPALVDACRLTAAQATYVAGYLSHLLLDDLWYHTIFAPVFLYGEFAGPGRQRFVLHNVLRLYVENQTEELFQTDALASVLCRASGEYGIPPFPDAILRSWRDLICTELTPGGARRSAAVLAERLGVEREEMLSILHSEERLQNEIFCRLPAGALEETLQRGIDVGARLVKAYLTGGNLSTICAVSRNPS